MFLDRGHHGLCSLEAGMADLNGRGRDVDRGRARLHLAAERGRIKDSACPCDGVVQGRDHVAA
jgi:hypothetical protein